MKTKQNISNELYQALQDQIIPVCNSNMGNRFYNTIIEINNDNAGITFKELIEALVDNKELILADNIVDNIDDDVLIEVHNKLNRDLSY